MLRLAVLLTLLVAFDVSAVAAQTPTRVRGVIERVGDTSLVVKARDGQPVTIALAPNAGVVAVTKAALSDVKPGTFVGIAALRQADGTFKAQEVVVFPESMRGTGEGHYPWDLTPNSTMTNATVDAVVSQVNGPVLTLKHKNGETKIAVPAEAPVVTLSPGDKTLLAPGAAVFVPATRADNGTLSTTRVLVGKDGVVPPM